MKNANEEKKTTIKNKRKKEKKLIKYENVINMMTK